MSHVLPDPTPVGLGAGIAAKGLPRTRARRQRWGRCPVCRGYVLRKFSTMRYLAPGSNRLEIQAQIQALADAWVPDFTHTAQERCAPKAQRPRSPR